MSTKIDFHAIRPFGPTILQGKLTDDMIKILDDRATELLDDDKLSKKYGQGSLDVETGTFTPTK